MIPNGRVKIYKVGIIRRQASVKWTKRKHMQTENVYGIKPTINDYKLQRDRVMRADSLDFLK